MDDFTYKITKKDLNDCWKFSLAYWLNESKGIGNRRVGNARGVGGIIDSFFLKIIEVAVCKILERKTKQNIEIPPDFEIRKLTKGKTEPDVFKIIDRKTKDERNPNNYIEAKLLEKNHNWVGPTKKELESISSNEFGIKDKSRMYYFWCEINDSMYDAEHKRQSSLVGSYLKSLIPKNDSLKPFHSYRNMSVKIKFIHTVPEVKNGIYFPKDSIFADPDCIKKNGCARFKKKFEENDLADYKKITLKNKTFPRPTVYANKKNNSLLKTIGNITYTGTVEMYLKKNKSKSYFFYCKTPVKITSGVGDWQLKKGDFRNYIFKPSGAFPDMRNSNYFLPRLKIEQQKLFVPTNALLQKIADTL